MTVHDLLLDGLHGATIMIITPRLPKGKADRVSTGASRQPADFLQPAGDRPVPDNEPAGRADKLNYGVTGSADKASLVRMESEQDRFWALLEPEYKGAMMFCRKLIGDRDRGDDLYQDALVIAFTKVNDLRDPAAFRPWLYRIIVTTFKSTVRRPWWKRRVPLTPDAELRLTSRNPVDRLTARRWLEHAFRAVSPDNRALVTLHELEGWPVAELAELFGKSEAAIKTSLFRARQKMKQALLKTSKQAEQKDLTKLTQRWREKCAAAKPEIE